jgi:hypothetical protein
MSNAPTQATEHTRNCQASRKDGQPCRSPAGYSSDYCYMHDPQRAQEAQEARSAGGKARHLVAPAEPIALRTVDAQIVAIEQTVDRVRAGQEPVNVARLVLYGISLARPLVELGEIEQRLAALEQGNGE